MSATTHATMHNDHRLWNGEIDFWHDDLRAWQTELAGAQAELKEVKKSLGEHANALRRHGSALRLLADDIRGHEHGLALLESGGESGVVQQLGQLHDDETNRQSHQRKAHERLKHNHHCLMVHCRLLFNVVQQCVSVKGETNADTD